jgi:DMSO reductase anchor subunit
VDDTRQLWLLPASEHPFPLPKQSRTEPHLAIRPHVGMLNGLEKEISNWEEIRPRHEKSKVRRFWTPKSPDFGIGELPLVAFTLLGQMAAGMAVFALFSGPLIAPVSVTIGGLIGLGGLASLLHLGSPQNAWRAVIHLRKSWLSREILMFGLFGISWLVSLALPGMGKLPLALCGLGLVYSMSMVYRLRSMAVWNANRTLLAFFVSALLLGGIGTETLNSFETTDFTPFTSLILGVGLVAALGLSLADRSPFHQTARRLRPGLIGLGLVGAFGMLVVSSIVGRWLIVPIFIIVLIEEALGRWLFYEQLNQRIL